MQRMLTGLVLFLTLVVGVLGLMIFKLNDRVTANARTPGPSPARRVQEASAEPEELVRLEGRVNALLSMIETLRREQRATAAALARQASRAGQEGSGDARIPDADRDALRRATNRAGGIQVTEEDEALYIAVKESVDRKRRIKGTVANTMRRIDRMAESGNIQPIPEADRKRVEAAVLRFVAGADDLSTRYIRKPSEQLKAMTAELRREAYKTERDTLVSEAQLALVPLVGEADASAIAEMTLKNRRRIRGRDIAEGYRRGERRR